MFYQKIDYVDYNGNKQSDDCYFNLNKVECLEIATYVDGDPENFMKKIVDEQDKTKMLEVLKMIILKSYGIKSADGKHFRKSKEISEDFESTEAFTELFMKMASDADFSEKFISGILPEMPKDAQKSLDLRNSVIPSNRS